MSISIEEKNKLKDELKKLEDLLKLKIINDEDFNSKKKIYEEKTGEAYIRNKVSTKSETHSPSSKISLEEKIKLKEELKKLENFLEKGIITEDDFNLKKKVYEDKTGESYSKQRFSGNFKK
eukprot:EC825739.1.p1 GENE.EC825739.1~~EC825739.1.p1  ORF type:complete len:121 (+),score=57.84 EC825739.1:261-623(+)